MFGIYSQSHMRVQRVSSSSYLVIPLRLLLLLFSLLLHLFMFLYFFLLLLFFNNLSQTAGLLSSRLMQHLSQCCVFTKVNLRRDFMHIRLIFPLAPKSRFYYRFDFLCFFPFHLSLLFLPSHPFVLQAFWTKGNRGKFSSPNI